MLSKSHGHVLRLAAVLHVLFSFFKGDTNPDTGDVDDIAITNDGNIPDHGDTISEAAIQAAIDFTQLSCMPANCVYCMQDGVFLIQVIPIK